jgi:predicted Kef-type K+ transport protein
MDHHPLIATIAVGLVLAFIFGAVAQRLRVSPLVGYLVAGIVVGPIRRALSPIRHWPANSPKSA